MIKHVDSNGVQPQAGDTVVQFTTLHTTTLHLIVEGRTSDAVVAVSYINT